MPGCRQAACLFTQHEAAQDLQQLPTPKKKKKSIQTDANHMTGHAELQKAPPEDCVCVRVSL